MKTSKWPTVAGNFRREITIWHAQAWAGQPELHSHPFGVKFGWKHEMNPHHGVTWSVYETAHKVQKLCELVDGKNLNEIVPSQTQPTAETLACWLLVRAPAFYDWIEIDCYGGFTVRVERADIPAEWRKIYLGTDISPSLTV